MALKVNEKSAVIHAHQKVWEMITALLGGTEAMRDAKTKYLPQFPAEEQDDYERRTNQATLYPAFRRTLSVMIGKPFSEPIVLKDVNPAVEELCDDIDLEGNSLHTWCASTFHEILAYGLGGILVDYPVVNGGSGARTRAEEKAVGARPYFVHIKHDQILGWQVTKVNGKPQLNQLRLWEYVEEPDGPWGTVLIPQVRVLYPGRWETWREKEVQGPTVNGGQTKVKEWALFESGVMTTPVIPFVFLYGIRKAYGDSDPPLADLAYLNVKHWQSQSDQDNILHIARVPILFGKGVDKESTLKIGQQAILTDNPQADLKYVEHTGASIGAGQSSLEKLELQMVQSGAELLVMKPGQRTATESNNDEDGNRSDLQRIVEGFEDSVDQALQIAADWMKVGEAGHIKLFSDFVAWSLDQATGVLIKDLVLAGLISKETGLGELQRRGIISVDVDPVTELQKVEEEGPPLGTMGLPANTPPGNGGGNLDNQPGGE